MTKNSTIIKYLNFKRADSSCLLHADDTTIITRCSNIKDLMMRASEDLEETMSWFQCNKLQLNADKTLTLVCLICTSKMAQSAHLLLRIVASSVTAANRAGKIVRDVMNKGDLGIVDKGKNDLQTEADRSAQQCIVGSLARQFPQMTIIGEEGASTCECPEEWVMTSSDPEVLSLSCPDEFHNLSESDVTVWVDPLDGTSEYTQGLLDHVTVLIGIAVKERAVAGVIHQPYYNYKDAEGGQLGRTIWGIEGVGVGGFDPKSPPEGKLIITTTRSHMTAQVQAALDALKPNEILRVGGAGHKVMLLMEGRAHAYVFASAGCKRWDTCAPEAVLSAMGGKLTDMHGRHYPYNKDTPHANSRGVLATANADDHDWYIKNIPQEIRQMLH